MIGEYKQGSTRRKRKQKKGPSTCSSSRAVVEKTCKSPIGSEEGTKTESESREKQKKLEGDGKISGSGCW